MTACNGVRLRILAICLATGALANVGCSSALVGTWKADPIPQDMDFYIVSAEFKDNGDYRATARAAGGEKKNLRGKYEFNGFNLKLMRPGSAAREYPAMYYITGYLEISMDDKSQRLKKQ